MKTVYIQSLGCEKNTVDAEIMIGILQDAGFSFTMDAEEADIIIINTCAFISDAKEESIDAILEHAIYKEHGKCERLIVSGCLPQRYESDIEEPFPEVDAFIGVNNLQNILEAVKTDGKIISPLSAVYEEYTSGRAHTSSAGSAFIRIADGCVSECSFCSIPKIRGRYKSRQPENIMEEARAFASMGVKEINLIAQESSYYGTDLTGKRELSSLLLELDKVEGIEWLRVLYQNPNMLNEKQIDTFFQGGKILPYFDIPMQHVNTSILRDMKRGGGYDEFLKLVESLRKRGECAIRTSFIVGFPGETEIEFKELCDFVEEARLDRMGIFVYSPEDGTAALSINKEVCDIDEARYRREILMTNQLLISEENLRGYVGKEIDVLVERITSDEIEGRSKFDAPDVDGRVILSNDNYNVCEGDIIKAIVDHANEHDLFGEMLS